MTKEELAALLNGREYMKEITREEEAQAKAAGLVVVFGASDDLIEFRGAIYGEEGCYDGGSFFIRRGIPADPLSADHDCECAFCGHAEAVREAVKIDAVWSEGDIAWQYRTEIPHATFDVMEDGEVYCRGIVFELPKE